MDRCFAQVLALSHIGIKPHLRACHRLQCLLTLLGQTSDMFKVLTCSLQEPKVRHVEGAVLLPAGVANSHGNISP